MPGATIFLKEIQTGKATDDTGSFTFSHLCASTYTAEIKFVGYITQEVKISLHGNERMTITLIADEKQLKEVIVTDHRNELSKAATIVQLSGKQLEETKGKSLGEALQAITGVNTIQSGPAIFKPVIHGVHSQRILILNNGIRQEGQQWGAEHAPEIDPFIASNIVVVKDAGAIKYGTDALGGVVIVTPAELPTEQKIGGEFHLIGATNGRSGTVSALLEGGLKKGWGWRIQGTGKKSGDAHAPDYNLSNTGFRELNYSASAGYHEEGKGIEFFYSHFNTTIGILRGSVVGSALDLAAAMEREPPQGTESFSYSINQPRQEVTHDLFKLNGHIRNGKNLFNLQYGLQINNRKEFDLRRGSLREVPALGYQLYTHTLDWEWERSVSESHSRCIGVNGMMQDNNKIDGTQTLPFIPNFTNYSAGLFWIEKLSLKKWDLAAGARYDFKYYNIAGFNFRNILYHSELDFHNVSGTLAGTFNINEQSSFTSSIGSAWRPPNVAELYSLGTHQSAAAIEFGLLLDEITNEVKSPEGNMKTEQAVKWVNTYRFQKNKLQGEVSGYLNYISNYIYLKPRGVTENTRGIFPYFRYTQTNASFLGADVSVSYAVSSAFKLTSKVSLLRAKDETQNDYLIFIPSNRYELAARYELPKAGTWTSFYAEMKLKYIDKQRRAPRVVPIREIVEAKQQGIDLLANDNRIFDFVDSPDGYLLPGFSAGISRPIGESKLDFRISVENLTNTSYREYSNRMRYYADDVGRNILLAVKYSF